MGASSDARNAIRRPMLPCDCDPRTWVEGPSHGTAGPKAANLDGGGRAGAPLGEYRDSMQTVPSRTHGFAMTHFADIWSYREQLRKSASDDREASLLVGSGVLHQCRAGIYANWEAILRCTAEHLEVMCEPEVAASHPTVAWETLMRRAAKARNLQANQCEDIARKFVAGLVAECESQISRTIGCSNAADIATFVARRRPRSIVTLNFTPVPFCTAKSTPVSKGAVIEYQADGRSVWCLHGSHADPDRLRLGVVRYSALIGEFAEWRNQYHSLRKKELKLDVMREGVEPRHRFVADILESPLLVVGCGLRSAEWTLWWLLASKARNEALHNSCPSAFITADAIDEGQRLALEGLHCKVIRVPSHGDAWSALEFLMERSTR